MDHAYSEDSSVNNYTEGSVPWGTSGLEFDGSDDHVIAGDIDLPGSFTVSAKFKAMSLDDYDMILGKGSSYYLWIDSTRQVRFEFHDGSGWRNVYGTAINVNEWYDVAATYDGSDLKIYVDGSLVNSAAYSNMIPLDNDHSLHIGNTMVHTGREFEGIINSVKIWNYALPPAEILAVMTGTHVDPVEDNVALMANGIINALQQKMIPGMVCNSQRLKYYMDSEVPPVKMFVQQPHRQLTGRRILAKTGSNSPVSAKGTSCSL